MLSHNRYGNHFGKLAPVMDNTFPVASNDPYDEDNEAQERRREERRKRKKQNRRRDQVLPEDDGDPDILLVEPKKQKRKKKKKERPDLWYDDALDNEEVFDEALELDDDWSDEWDS